MSVIKPILGQRYEMQQLIGTGGMGAVYRGMDTQTGDFVAIKLLKPELIARDTGSAMLERFAREAALLKELNHPNIVKVLATVEEDNTSYIIMEYISGGTLQDYLKRHSPLPIAEVLDIALDLADALTRAHRLKIIHRDIKPANILMAADGTPRLTDFGIAFTEKLDRLTPVDHGIGTPDYMSPESALGQPIDGRSDIWSMGVLVFEMLTGQRPFKGESLAQVVAAIMTRRIPDLEMMRPDCPIPLVDLVYRMLEKEPNARIPSVRQVGAELEAIAAGRLDWRVETGDSRRFNTPPPSTSEETHGLLRLPAQATNFVGRKQELAELRAFLGDSTTRLITILAPGGMGKTRLAVEAAHQEHQRFPGGVYYVALSPLTEPANIVQRIADVLNFPLQANNIPPISQLLDVLREKTLLLLLDNFEHLTKGAQILGELLEGAPHLTLLVTSRERLHLSSETIFEIGGMDFPNRATFEDVKQSSAAQLFIQSARRVQPGFELLAENYRQIAHICRMVQGMPLAIVLAAAWVEMLTLDEIEQELRNTPDFLDADMRDLPERHRSIRAVFDYSWKVLSEEERSIFMRLALFRGGFTRQSAYAVVGASLKMLTAFVNKSLLRRMVATGRYEIHELLRQYAEQRLIDSGHAPAARRDFAGYFMRLIQQSEAGLKGVEQANTFDQLNPEIENIRIAWNIALELRDFGAIDKALETARWFIIFRSRYQGGLDMLRDALEAMQSDKDPLVAYMRQRLRMRLTFIQRWRDGSYTHIEDASWQVSATLALAQARADDAETAACFFMQGDIAYTQRQYETAMPLFEQALAIYELLVDDFYLAWCYHFMGLCSGFVGKSDRALAYHRQSLDLRRRIGDKMGVSFSLQNLGLQALYNGAPELANDYFREYVALTRDLEDISAFAMGGLIMGLPPLLRGDIDLAKQAAEQALNAATELNHALGRAYALDILGVGAVLEGEILLGRLLCQESLGFAPKPDARFLADWGLAMAYASLGEMPAAGEHYQAMRQFALRSHSVLAIVLSLPIGALLRSHEGDTYGAIEMLGFAATFPPSLTGWIAHWSGFLTWQQSLRDLPDFAGAWARGQALQLDMLIQADNAR